MSGCAEFEVRAALSPDDLGQVKELFLAYANGLGFELCFQDFAREVAELPGDYAAEKRGALLLADCAGKAVGCVALHASFGEAREGHTCEMKRLYVNPQWRGNNIGRGLVVAVMEQARGLGYLYMRLDTVPSKMEKAVELYRRAGFYEIPAYRPNPAPDVLYMEVKL